MTLQSWAGRRASVPHHGGGVEGPEQRRLGAGLHSPTGSCPCCCPGTCSWPDASSSCAAAATPGSSPPARRWGRSAGGLSVEDGTELVPSRPRPPWPPEARGLTLGTKPGSTFFSLSSAHSTPARAGAARMSCRLDTRCLGFTVSSWNKALVSSPGTGLVSPDPPAGSGCSPAHCSRSPAQRCNRMGLTLTGPGRPCGTGDHHSRPFQGEYQRPGRGFPSKACGSSPPPPGPVGERCPLEPPGPVWTQRHVVKAG